MASRHYPSRPCIPYICNVYASPGQDCGWELVLQNLANEIHIFTKALLFSFFHYMIELQISPRIQLVLRPVYLSTQTWILLAAAALEIAAELQLFFFKLLQENRLTLNLHYIAMILQDKCLCLKYKRTSILSFLLLQANPLLTF